MQASVRIVDWTPGSERQARPALKVVSETMTAGELVAERVRTECRAFGEKMGEEERRARSSISLVVPGRIEQRLNGGARTYGPASVGQKNGRDADDYVAIARRAFESGQYVMFFDGRQVETWDERITIREDSLATFIRLTPLKGG
jgi:hypothetical protein